MAEPQYDEAGAQIRTVRTRAGDKLAASIQEEVWSLATTPKDNDVQYAVRSGETGKSHYIVAVGASFSDPALGGKQMKLYDGETLLLSQYVYGRGVVISFPTPIKITAGADAKVDLEASGTAGKYGLVWIAGYTK